MPQVGTARAHGVRDPTADRTFLARRLDETSARGAAARVAAAKAHLARRVVAHDARTLLGIRRPPAAEASTAPTAAKAVGTAAAVGRVGRVQ